MKSLESVWLGRVPYAEALELQARMHEARARDEVPDTLIQLEHESVFTIGRRGSRAEVLWDDETLRQRGVTVYDADRGGQVTYHGPGQLVGYPIVSLGRGADLVRYLRNLEEALIRALASFGVAAGRVDGHAGVWVGDSKIAAVGVRVTKGVTKHGYALNVAPDLAFFSGIIPCGITSRGVTSMAALVDVVPTVEGAASEVERHLSEVLGLRVVRAVSA